MTSVGGASGVDSTSGPGPGPGPEATLVPEFNSGLYR